MAAAKWGAPASLSASLVTTELDSLANAAETAVFTLDNSSDKYLYSSVTVKLGSITPSAGGSITLRVYVSDGTNVADKSGGGEAYTQILLSGASAKIVVFPMIRLYPFSLRLTITNNSGVSLNAADNDVYVRNYNEDVS